MSERMATNRNDGDVAIQELNDLLHTEGLIPLHIYNYLEGLTTHRTSLSQTEMENIHDYWLEFLGDSTND